MIRSQMLYLVGCVEDTQTEGFLLLPVIIHKTRRSCNLPQVYTQPSALLPKVTGISEGLRSTLGFQLCGAAFLLP